jgi:hypothetical protein
MNYTSTLAMASIVHMHLAPANFQIANFQAVLDRKTISVGIFRKGCLTSAIPPTWRFFVLKIGKRAL